MCSHIHRHTHACTQALTCLLLLSWDWWEPWELNVIMAVRVAVIHSSQPFLSHCLLPKRKDFSCFLLWQAHCSKIMFQDTWGAFLPFACVLLITSLIDMTWQRTIVSLFSGYGNTELMNPKKLEFLQEPPAGRRNILSQSEGSKSKGGIYNLSLGGETQAETVRSRTTSWLQLLHDTYNYSPSTQPQTSSWNPENGDRGLGWGALLGLLVPFPNVATFSTFLYDLTRFN